MFFLMRDWERDMVEPCLLAREIEVALDIDAASFILPVSVLWSKLRTGESRIRLVVAPPRLAR